MNKIGSVEKTTKLLNENDFQIKKKFGQNFIIDQNILNNIVDAANLDDETDVIEVGPGLGSLTELLLKKARRVMSFEIDDDLIPILKNNFKDMSNFILVHNDILKVDINEEIKKHFEDSKRIVLVANLPYYITTPIILKLLCETKLIKSYTMMMQDEVADRICSLENKKDYNALSIAIQYRCSAKKVLKISRNIFIPKPNVDSAVVRLDLYETPKYQNVDEAFFFKLIRDAFFQRRKTLVNNLKQTGYNKELVLDALKKLNLNESIRSEALSINDFINLANLLNL